MKDKMEECTFCKIVKGEIPKDFTYEDDNFVAFPDSNPRTEGHTLIVSKKHFRNLLDMPVSLGNELLEMIKKVSLKLIGENKGEGVKVVCNNESNAGQVVFHVHVHVIPMKKGDNVEI